MIKKLLLLAGILLLCYVVLAVFVLSRANKALADADRRAWDIRVATLRITQDQRTVSERTKAATKKTLESGKQKTDEIAELLGDEELNRLARIYLGRDWAVQRSEFMGQVQHSRNLLTKQKRSKVDSLKSIEDKIAQLEKRKKFLLEVIHNPYKTNIRVSEIRDIDNQLWNLRTTLRESKFRDSGTSDAKFIESIAKSEEALFKLAVDVQNATLGALNRSLGDNLFRLRDEEAGIQGVRRTIDLFNVWPLNRLMKVNR